MEKEDLNSVALPTGAQMKKALEKSGYLFEHKIAKLMESRGFHVESSWAYKDPDQEKSREVDVKALRQIRRDEANKVQVFCEFLVECKSSDSPIVFLQAEKNEREKKSPSPREYVFPIARYEKYESETSYTEVEAFIRFGLAQNHYYYSSPLKATQFAKIVRKGADWHANHDGVYDSMILPQVKALEQRRSEVKVPYTKGQWTYIWLFFSVVVLRDHLFVLSPGEDGAMPVSAGRVSFVRHVRTGELDEHYLVDFVTEKYLGTYLDEVTAFAQSVETLLPDAPARLLNKKFRE